MIKVAQISRASLIDVVKIAETASSYKFGTKIEFFNDEASQGWMITIYNKPAFYDVGYWDRLDDDPLYIPGEAPFDPVKFWATVARNNLKGVVYDD